MSLLRCALLGAIGIGVVTQTAHAEIRRIMLDVQWKDASDRDAEWKIGEPISGDVRVEGDLSIVRESRHYPGWDVDWVMTTQRGADRASVISTTAVTNNSGVPQVFNLSVSDLAMVDIGAPTQTITSMSLSIADGNGDGATASDDTFNPIYLASINSNPVDTLGDPLTLVAGAERTNSITQSNAIGGGGPLLSTDTLGIDNVFVVSPGDTATIVSTFAVVPEPASLGLLLGASTVALAVRRRRVR